MLVPSSERTRGAEGGFEETQQGFPRILRRADRFIGQDEFAQIPIETRRAGGHRLPIEPGGRRIGVGIEAWLCDPASTGPETGGADFVTKGLSRDAVGKIRNAAGVERRTLTRKARDRQIKASPEQMDGADLAQKGGAEFADPASIRTSAR